MSDGSLVIGPGIKDLVKWNIFTTSWKFTVEGITDYYKIVSIAMENGLFNLRLMDARYPSLQPIDVELSLEPEVSGGKVLKDLVVKSPRMPRASEFMPNFLGGPTVSGLMQAFIDARPFFMEGVGIPQKTTLFTVLQIDLPQAGGMFLTGHRVTSGPNVVQIEANMSGFYNWTNCSAMLSFTN